MKKITRILCMMAVVVLAFTSCKKQENSAKSVVFNHSMESLVTVEDENEFGKVYYDQNNQIAFEEGDMLMLFDISNDTAVNSLYELVTSDDQTLLTVVNGWDPLPATTTGAYYAFYPGQNVVATNMDEHRATFRLDDTQIYRNAQVGQKTYLPKDALYIAAKAEQTTLSAAMFNCRNICGVFKLNLYSPSGKKVKKIEVTDNLVNIVGDVNLKVDKVDPDVMTALLNEYGGSNYQTDLAAYINEVGYNISNPGKTLTLDCGNGASMGRTKATASPFYLVMRPLALVKGCNIVITFTNGTTKTISTSKDIRIRPNTIRNMTAVNVG